MSRPRLLFALGLAATLPASPTLAVPADSPPTMEEIVVTAGRIAEDKKTVSSHVSLINREEIEQSSAATVADLLAERGIGHIQKYPGAMTAIGLRGFRSDTHGNDLQGHVLILLDGRRAGTGNAAKLLTGNVERIEIIRGPAAVQYGSAGMGGVVNIITRRGTENGGAVGIGGGSDDQVEGDLGLTAVSGRFDFAGSLNLLQSGDYRTGSGATYANTGIDRQTGISANAGYTFAERHRVGMTFTGFAADDAGSPGFLSQNDLDDTTDKDNWSVDTTYTGSTTDGATNWLGRYFLGRDKNSWSEPTASNPDGWDSGLESRNTTDQQGAQMQASRDFGFSTLTAGFDWLDYEVENSWSPQQTSYANPALFLLSKTPILGKRLHLSAGLRQDWFTVEMDEPAGRSEDQSHLTPQVGLAWQAVDSLTLRLQYAEGFTVPSADQLAADFVSWGVHTVGNADLDPEQSRTWETGLDYNRSGLTGSLTWFHTDFSDKIVVDSLVDGSSSWKNQGDATVSGLELEVGYDLGVPLGLDWSLRPYVHLTLLDQLEDETTGEDLQYVSAVTAAYGVAVDSGRGFSCRLNLTHIGSQDVQDYESGAFPAPVVELDSATVADLTATWTVMRFTGAGLLKLKGSLLNLTDEDYAYVKGYPMPGRTVWAGLRWEF